VNNLKINEVFEKLIENPKDVYGVICEDGWRKEMSICKDGYFTFRRYNKNGELLDTELRSGGFNGNIKHSDNWQLVRKPVDFMTAINSNQNVKPEKFYREIGFMKPETWLRNVSLTVEDINGKWLVE
jgi:hypothetical protein